MYATRHIFCAITILTVTNAVTPNAWAQDAAPDSDSRSKAEKAADARYGLHLTRSFVGADAKKGALFSLSHAGGRGDEAEGDDTVFSADFALIYRVPVAYTAAFRFGAGEVDPVLAASVEGHVATNNGDDVQAEDALRARLTAEFNWTADAEEAQIPFVFTSTSLKYEADQDLDNEKLVVELLAWPIVPGLYIGEPPLSRFEWSYNHNDFGFTWLPSLGVEVGETLDAEAESNEQEDTVLRLLLNVEADLSLKRLVANAQQKNPEGVKLKFADDVVFFASNKFYYLPLEDDDQTHNLFVAGVDFRLNENAGFQIAYTVGRDAPSFEKSETVEAGFTLRF